MLYKDVRRTRRLLSLLAVAAGLIYPIPVWADTAPNFSMSVSPVQVNLLLNKGETRTEQIKVANTGDTPFDFLVEVAPYSTATLAHYGQIARWITFDQTTFHLDPGSETLVAFTVTVPDSAVAGAQYATIAAETTAMPAERGGMGVSAKRRISALVVARVNGNEVRQGGQLTVEGNNSIAPKIIITNTGNTDFLAETTLVVSNRFTDHELYRSTTSSDFVFPEASKEIATLSWDDAPLVGWFSVKVTSQFLNQVHTETYTVWSCPLPLSIILATGILGVVLSSIALTRKRKIIRRRK